MVTIFGTQCFAQFLWYARTYLVRVAAQFMHVRVLRDVILLVSLSNYLPEMTSVDLDKAFVPIQNQIVKKKMVDNLIQFLLGIHSVHVLGAIRVVCLAILCGRCV